MTLRTVFCGTIAFLFFASCPSISFGQFGKVKTFLKNVGSKIEDAAEEVKDELDTVGDSTERAFTKLGDDFEALGEVLEDLYEDIKKELNEAVLEAMKKAVMQQHGGLINKTKENWSEIASTNKAKMNELKTAVVKKDHNKVVKLLADLFLNNTAFSSIIDSAKDKKMGSIIVLVSGDAAGPGVSANAALGNAVDVESLVYLAKNGKLKPGRTLLSSFVTVGGVVGFSGGLSTDVAIGFDLDSPDEIQGPGVDVIFEFSNGPGGNVSFGFAPDEGMKFAGFTAGMSGGANFRGGAGLSFTHILTRVHTDDLGAVVASDLVGSNKNGGIVAAVSYKGDIIASRTNGGIYRRQASKPIGDSSERAVYPPGRQTVIKLVVANGGIYSAFSGGGIYFSPDGNRLGAGIKVYDGSSRVTDMVVLKGAGINGRDAIITVFENGRFGAYRSMDGYDLGGGKNTTRVYPPGKASITAIATGNGGVYTAFKLSGGTSIYFSPLNSQSIGTGSVVYKGSVVPTKIVALPKAGSNKRDAILTVFAGGLSGVYRSNDGLNLGGGGNSSLVYPVNRLSIIDMVAANGGVYTAFRFSKGSSVYFSPNGFDVGAGMKIYTGSKVVTRLVVESGGKKGRDTIITTF